MVLLPVAAVFAAFGAVAALPAAAVRPAPTNREIGRMTNRAVYVAQLDVLGGFIHACLGAWLVARDPSREGRTGRVRRPVGPRPQARSVYKSADFVTLSVVAALLRSKRSMWGR